MPIVGLETREAVRDSLVCAISKVFQFYMEGDATISGIAGVMGIEFKSGHALLVDIKERPKTINDGDPNYSFWKDYENGFNPYIDPTVITADIKDEPDDSYGTDDANISKEYEKYSKVIGQVAFIDYPSAGAENMSKPGTDRQGTPQKKKENTPTTANTSRSAGTKRKFHGGSPALTTSTPKANRREVDKDMSSGVMVGDEARELCDISNSKDHHFSPTELNERRNACGFYLITTPSGSYMCSICDRLFAQKDSARRHILFKHLGIGLDCTKCGKTCRDKTELTDHVVSEHSEGIPSYQCSECGKWLKTRRTLKRHVSYVHRGFSRQFICHLCDLKFNTSKDCQDHLENSHAKCPKCDIFYVSLNDHECRGSKEMLSPKKVPRQAIGTLAQAVAASVHSENHVTVDGEDGIREDFRMDTRTPSPTPSECTADSDFTEFDDILSIVDVDEESNSHTISGCDFLQVEEIGKDSEIADQVVIEVD